VHLDSRLADRPNHDYIGRTQGPARTTISTCSGSWTRSATAHGNGHVTHERGGVCRKSRHKSRSDVPETRLERAVMSAPNPREFAPDCTLWACYFEPLNRAITRVAGCPLTPARSRVIDRGERAAATWPLAGPRRTAWRRMAVPDCVAVPCTRSHHGVRSPEGALIAVSNYCGLCGSCLPRCSTFA
jgi:hypothetical protein